MRHIISKYPKETPYHDDMLGETVFIVGLPFWHIHSDDSRGHDFFEDFRIFNGVPLWKMNMALEELEAGLRAVQRTIMETRMAKEGWDRHGWNTEARINWPKTGKKDE